VDVFEVCVILASLPSMETFTDLHFACRGDLENPSTREAFYRGYELWSNFFAKHLS
jgi:hypothetical protein